MNHERLRQIIIEEILRAVAEVRGGGAPRPAGRPHPVVSGREAVLNPGPAGIVLLTGDSPVADSLLNVIASLAQSGHRLLGVPSLSFRLSRPGQGAAPAGLRLAANPDDEAAMAALGSRSDYLLAPDLSINTLNKCLAGAEDSAPTRMISHMLRERKHVVLLESGEGRGPVGRRARIDPLRELVHAGGVISTPEEVETTLADLLRPEEDRWFKPKPPKPPLRKKIFTKDDVIALRMARKIELIVPDGSIVTGEAREFARRWGIRIRHEEDL